jgi:zinc transport system substrate-binding protein
VSVVRSCQAALNCSVALLMAAAVFAPLGCQRTPDPWQGSTRLRVVASIAPLYCFTAQIAEPDADVLCLLSAKGPHDFQPTTHDAKLLGTADVLIVNGLGLEEFLDKVVAQSGNRMLKVVKAGEAIPKDQLLEAEGVPHYHGTQLVVHRGTDPHVWLGTAESKLMVDAIAMALGEKAPAQAAAFRTRAEAVKQKLDRLAAQGKELKLDGGLVTFHDSFRYFGRSFGIPIAGVIRGVRGEEAAASQIVEQAREFRAKDVRLIGVEPQYPRRVAESLAREIGPERVRIIELDPLETAPLVDGHAHKVDRDWYFKQMERNLQNLRPRS